MVHLIFLVYHLCTTIDWNVWHGAPTLQPKQKGQTMHLIVFLHHLCSTIDWNVLKGHVCEIGRSNTNGMPVVCKLHTKGLQPSCAAWHRHMNIVGIIDFICT